MSGSTITITVPDGQFSAYMAKPSNPSNATIIIIQEIFGVNKVMRDLCDDYAREGYTAICPDLFWRIEPGVDITDQSQAEWDKAFQLYQAFDVAKGVEDLKGTIAHARKSAAKVGSIGFCLGGLLAYLTATRTDVDAAVGYYGVGIDGFLDEGVSISTPVMLHIAEEDGFVSKEAQAAIKSRLTSANYVLHSYPGRDHAFARVGGEHYDVGDTELSKKRTLDFLRQHLKD